MTTDITQGFERRQSWLRFELDASWL